MLTSVGKCICTFMREPPMVPVYEGPHVVPCMRAHPWARCCGVCSDFGVVKRCIVIGEGIALGRVLLSLE